ncbi:hypothetical protein V5799_030513, partial [Amblyomma americanum]
RHDPGLLGHTYRYVRRVLGKDAWPPSGPLLSIRQCDKWGCAATSHGILALIRALAQPRSEE